MFLKIDPWDPELEDLEYGISHPIVVVHRSYNAIVRYTVM